MSGNSDRRYLVISGTIQNQTSSTTFVNIVCTAVVSVHFENGKSVDISSEDICGDPGGSAMTFMTGDTSVADLTKLKLEPGASHGVDTSTGGEITAAVVSPLFNEKYSSYPVSETQLQIQVTAETAFGDHVRETILRTNIPSPSHKARFDFM